MSKDFQFDIKTFSPFSFDFYQLNNKTRNWRHLVWVVEFLFVFHWSMSIVFSINFFKWRDCFIQKVKTSLTQQFWQSEIRIKMLQEQKTCWWKNVRSDCLSSYLFYFSSIWLIESKKNRSLQDRSWNGDIFQYEFRDCEQYILVQVIRKSIDSLFLCLVLKWDKTKRLVKQWTWDNWFVLRRFIWNFSLIFGLVFESVLHVL